MLAVRPALFLEAVSKLEVTPRATHFVRCKKTNVVELGSLHKLSLGRPWLPPRRARGGEVEEQCQQVDAGALREPSG